MKNLKKLLYFFGIIFAIIGILMNKKCLSALSMLSIIFEIFLEDFPKFTIFQTLYYVYFI